MTEFVLKMLTKKRQIDFVLSIQSAKTIGVFLKESLTGCPWPYIYERKNFSLFSKQTLHSFILNHQYGKYIPATTMEKNAAFCKKP